MPFYRPPADTIDEGRDDNSYSRFPLRLFCSIPDKNVHISVRLIWVQSVDFLRTHVTEDVRVCKLTLCDIGDNTSTRGMYVNERSLFSASLFNALCNSLC